MSWSAETELEFGGEKRKFRLGINELDLLEEQCGPVFDMWRRTSPLIGRLTRKETVAIIRAGLVGAGEKPADADKLLGDFTFPNRPYLEQWALAARILDNTFSEPEGAPEGNGLAADDQTTTDA